MLMLRNLIVIVIAGFLGACVHLPTGPSVMALPGSGKNFDQFRSDEYVCKQYAYEQVEGYTPRTASRMSGIENAALGSGLGAAAGAILGGGHGAAIGAGIGLLFGSVLGSSNATASGYASQQRYDNGYVQCMYAKGHSVPVDGRIMNSPSGRNTVSRIAAPASENFVPPPPPPGSPPPPPLR
ncbi:YMGG-like glycine zipper-containing protein [uncultured Nitrosomonas sp.]|uniref:YMGG-like glycine zipper-containing protein n=1 Tax=uncultured Nitrosomonas sp. TaxID=156424 RepID=UPI0025CDC8F7|nr:YMGG-like glycine zipper-containing protein [uncultured Nitrosomonas sp.]